MSKFKLSGNTLKIFAAIAMVIDHFAVVFTNVLPHPLFIALRIIGRLSFPIFAFMISEGARYTKNKLRHFLMIFSLGVFCQLVFLFVGGKGPLNILITFSISILLIYSLNYFKKAVFSANAHLIKKIASGGLFIAGIVGAYIFNSYFLYDYGFFGCITPVASSLFDFKGINVPTRIKKLDTITLRVLSSLVAVILIIITNWDYVRLCLLLSFILLFLYSGKKGNANMKYFFYIFYPIHLAALQGLHMLIGLVSG